MKEVKKNLGCNIGIYQTKKRKVNHFVIRIRFIQTHSHTVKVIHRQRNKPGGHPGSGSCPLNKKSHPSSIVLTQKKKKIQQISSHISKIVLIVKQ